VGAVDRLFQGAEPSLVQELVRARRRRDPLDVLSLREREVLALMAEGASNAGIARQIFVTEGTVEKYVRSILTNRPAGERNRAPPGAGRPQVPRNPLRYQPEASSLLTQGR
jgi:DNA-binding NarL/FixJ family response regulator